MPKVRRSSFDILLLIAKSTYKICKYDKPTQEYMKRQNAENSECRAHKAYRNGFGANSGETPAEKCENEMTIRFCFFRISCTNYGSFEFLSEIRHIFTNAQAHRAYVCATSLAGETSFPFFRYSVVAVRGA